MPSSLDPREFRSALGAFATGVTIVTTTDREGRDFGLTASSFNSVSLDPPMVLWSLANSSGSLPAFMAATHFAVHVLSQEQERLSNQFASRNVDKFSGVEIKRGEGGVPLLDGCAARFQCRTASRYEGGDHTIFVGEVLAFDHSARLPLLFHSGSYKTAARPQQRLPELGMASRWGDTLGHLLASAYLELIDPVRKRASELGLTVASHHVLRMLMGAGKSSRREMNALIAYTGIEIQPENVKELMGRGLIEAEPGDPELLLLTSSGRQMMIELIALARAAEAEVQLHVGSEDGHQLRATLQRMIAHISPAQSRVAAHLAVLCDIGFDRDTDQEEQLEVPASG